MNPAAILALIGELYEAAANVRQQLAAVSEQLAQVTAERDDLLERAKADG